MVVGLSLKREHVLILCNIVHLCPYYQVNHVQTHFLMNAFVFLKVFQFLDGNFLH